MNSIIFHLTVSWKVLFQYIQNRFYIMKKPMFILKKWNKNLKASDLPSVLMIIISIRVLVCVYTVSLRGSDLVRADTRLAGEATWNHLAIGVLLAKLSCQTPWDSQPTKQPKKIKYLEAFTSWWFLIVSVGISGLDLLWYHLSVRIT